MANLVVTLLGQSNCQGQGLNTELPAATSAAITALAGKVKLYVGGDADASVKGSWINLRSGTGYDIDHFGPEIALGLALSTAYPSDTIYIIKHGVGSTTLYSDWLPPAGGTWTAAAATIAAAIAAMAAPVPIGIVWVQGESDANSTAANALAYRDNILTLIDAARAALSSTRCPFVVMGLSEVLSYSWSYRVRSGQYAATRKRPLVWVADSTGLPWDGGVHFTAAGQLALGAKLAAPLQDRTSRPLVAAPGMLIENVALCPSNLLTGLHCTLAHSDDLNPRAGDCAFGAWIKAQPHAAQALWTRKATGGEWRPFYQQATGIVSAYISDGVTSPLAIGTHKARDTWDFYWTTMDRTRLKLEIWCGLDLIGQADLGALGDVNPSGDMLIGTFDGVAGGMKINDLIWRKGGKWSWDDVRRYLCDGTAIPTGGTKQITWAAREGAGTTVTSVPAGYNGTLGAATWSTLTRQKARVAA